MSGRRSAVKVLKRQKMDYDKTRFPPGVYKHRTVEEAEELRKVWEQANFEAFHARRQASA